MLRLATPRGGRDHSLRPLPVGTHLSGRESGKIVGCRNGGHRDGGSSDPKAALAVRFAKEIVRTRGNVSDADVKAAKQAGYSDAQIIEIVLHVAHNTLTNYVNVVAKTVIDFEVVAARPFK